MSRRTPRRMWGKPRLVSHRCYKPGQERPKRPTHRHLYLGPLALMVY